MFQIRKIIEYRFLGLMIIGFLVVGCVSYKAIKIRDIDIVYTADKITSVNLSLCVEDRLLEDSYVLGPKIHRKYDHIKKKWFVLGEFVTLLNSGTGNYQYSLSFTDTENGSIVELRSRKTIFGGLQAPKQAIQDIIDLCKES